MRVDDLLARLESVTGGDGQWYARCPSHDDRQASLSVALGRDGRILLTCWAGCELDAITQALGVSVADLFAHDDGLGTQQGWLGRALKPLMPELDELERWAVRLQRSPDVLARIFELKGWRADVLAALGIGLKGERLTIPVLDLDGAVVLNLLRYWPEAKPKMLAMRGRPRTPLYVIVDDSAPLWIVEGETDAIALAMLGLNAIGAPGASTKAKAEWLELVRGRVVIVCMDVDDAGRRAAQRWALTASNKGAERVHVVELNGPKGYDVGDMLVEHKSEPGVMRAKLYELVERTPAFEPVRVANLVLTPSEPPSESNGEGKVGDVITRSLSTITPERLRMRWRDRIPVGRVGIIYGPPGQGKSTLLALIAADVTAAGGHVLVASAEDDPATTLLPRMIAAGADIGLVDVISTRASKGETSLVLPRDLDALGKRMRDAALLIVDPLSAHLGADVNAWSEQDVRAKVLAPLAFYARETGCSCPLVMHLNKSNGTDPLSRISGSGGFGGAARFVLLLGTHPDDIGLDEDERRLALVHVKASESSKQHAIVFRRRIAAVDTNDDGIATVPVLELEDDLASVSAESVLEHTDPDEAGAFSEAIEYLRRELSDGAKPAKRLLAAARERGDFSDRTLRKAKRALGVKSWRDGASWYWERAQ